MHFFMSVFVSLGAKPHWDSSKSSSTIVKSNRLVSGRLLPLLRERLVEDLAILRRLYSVNLFSLGQHKYSLA